MPLVRVATLATVKNMPKFLLQDIEKDGTEQFADSESLEHTREKIQGAIDLQEFGRTKGTKLFDVEISAHPHGVLHNVMMTVRSPKKPKDLAAMRTWMLEKRGDMIALFLQTHFAGDASRSPKRVVHEMVAHPLIYALMAHYAAVHGAKRLLIPSSDFQMARKGYKSDFLKGVLEQRGVSEKTLDKWDSLSPEEVDDMLEDRETVVKLTSKGVRPVRKRLAMPRSLLRQIYDEQAVKLGLSHEVIDSPDPKDVPGKFKFYVMPTQPYHEMMKHFIEEPSGNDL